MTRTSCVASSRPRWAGPTRHACSSSPVCRCSGWPSVSPWVPSRCGSCCTSVRCRARRCRGPALTCSVWWPPGRLRKRRYERDRGLRAERGRCWAAGGRPRRRAPRHRLDGCCRHPEDDGNRPVARGHRRVPAARPASPSSRYWPRRRPRRCGRSGFGCGRRSAALARRPRPAAASTRMTSRWWSTSSRGASRRGCHAMLDAAALRSGDRMYAACHAVAVRLRSGMPPPGGLAGMARPTLAGPGGADRGADRCDRRGGRRRPSPDCDAAACRRRAAAHHRVRARRRSGCVVPLGCASSRRSCWWPSSRWWWGWCRRCTDGAIDERPHRTPGRLAVHISPIAVLLPGRPVEARDVPMTSGSAPAGSRREGRSR